MIIASSNTKSGLISQYNWNCTYLHTILPNNGKVFRRLKPAGQRLIASNKTQSIQPQKIYPILHERTLFLRLLKNVWHIAREIERFSSWQKRKRVPKTHLDMLMFELWTNFTSHCDFMSFCCILGCMMMNSRGGPPFGGCMLMNARGQPPYPL